MWHCKHALQTWMISKTQQEYIVCQVAEASQNTGLTEKSVEDFKSEVEKISATTTDNDERFWRLWARQKT